MRNPAIELSFRRTIADQTFVFCTRCGEKLVSLGENSSFKRNMEAFQAIHGHHQDRHELRNAGDNAVK